MRIDIRDPDPDNFPNGAYTVSKARVYIENSPVGFYGPSVLGPPQHHRVGHGCRGYLDD
jgi:hypothetical protein